MKVVFLKDVSEKARAGEVKEVSTGYARNYLLPKGLALVVTPTVMKEVEDRLEKERREDAANNAKLAELAQELEGREIHIRTKIGVGERLFGSITAADIAEELTRATGVEVDKKKVGIEKPLRQAGSHSVEIRLASDIRPCVTVVIEQETEAEKE